LLCGKAFSRGEWTLPRGFPPAGVISPKGRLRGTPSPLAVSTKIFGYEGRKVKPVIASANVGLAQQRPFARNLQRERELPIGTLWGLRPPAISQTVKLRFDEQRTLISTNHR
jgi:hypothetical protein